MLTYCKVVQVGERNVLVILGKPDIGISTSSKLLLHEISSVRKAVAQFDVQEAVWDRWRRHARANVSRLERPLELCAEFCEFTEPHSA